uniref:C-type lectin domain-containing protein n=1 Tax=Lates calcarifer TaxID=8187 RepID=A0A4W6EU42_LATCA
MSLYLGNQTTPGCPPDWTRLGSRCFIFQNSHRSMGDAENICLSLGGNLASVHSAAENRLLRELIRKESGEAFTNTQDLPSCLQKKPEGQWMWTDGSNFDYQIWGPGEPNNHGGAENCIEMNWQHLKRVTT